MELGRFVSFWVLDQEKKNKKEGRGEGVFLSSAQLT